MTSRPRNFSTNTKTASRAAIVLAFTLAIAVLVGCGGDKEKVFTTPTYPFTFDYPNGWAVARDAKFSFGGATGERSVSVVYKNPDDQVAITQYKLKKTLPAGINGNQKEVDGIVKRLAKQASGSASDAKIVSHGGIPGYEYIVEYSTPGGKPVQNRMTFLFKGNDEFQIQCQSTEKNRAAVEKGCRQILDSLKFT